MLPGNFAHFLHNNKCIILRIKVLLVHSPYKTCLMRSYSAIINTWHRLLVHITCNLEISRKDMQLLFHLFITTWPVTFYPPWLTLSLTIESREYDHHMRYSRNIPFFYTRGSWHWDIYIKYSLVIRCTGHHHKNCLGSPLGMKTWAAPHCHFHEHGLAAGLRNPLWVWGL